MAFTRTRKSVDETPAKGGKGDRKPQIRDQVGMVEWPKAAKFLTVRLFPGVVPVGIHDYPLYRKDGSKVVNEKYKDAKTGEAKQSMVQKICLNFNTETVERDLGEECPYCDLDLYFKVEYWAEGIVREEQENEPAKHKASKEELKSGIKDFENDSSWTPVRVFKHSSKGFGKIKGLKQLNKIKKGTEKIPFPVDDEENGCELNMNFDPDATGAEMYGVQKGDAAPITEEENELLRWDIEGAVEKAKEDLDEAQRNAAWYNKHANGETADAGGDEEYDPEEGDSVKLTLEEDDEEVFGKCVESTTKFIIIEDADGEERKIKWTEVTKVEKAKAPKAAAKGKKPVAKDEDDDIPAKPAAKKKPVAKPEPDYEPEEGDWVVVKDADDDEIVSGEVTSVDAKSITVTDADGDEHTHRLAKVTVEKAEKAEKPKPKGKAAAKKVEPEPDDNYEPEEGDMVVIKDDDELVTGKVTDIDAKSITVEDAEGEEHTHRLAKVTVEKARAKPAKGAKKPAPKDEPEDDDPPAKPKKVVKEEDEDATPPRKKTATRSFDFD